MKKKFVFCFNKAKEEEKRKKREAQKIYSYRCRCVHHEDQLVAGRDRSGATHSRKCSTRLHDVVPVCCFVCKGRLRIAFIHFQKDELGQQMNVLPNFTCLTVARICQPALPSGGVLHSYTWPIMIGIFVARIRAGCFACV